MGFEYVRHLASIGAFREGKARVLDIGTQNLMLAEADAIVEFARRFGATLGGKALREEAERISYFSTPRLGERTSYLSELFDLTSIEYTSFDVCPGLKTEIFDLNCQQLDAGRRETFDLVINCGTAEHVLNQLNCFSVMHDALKPGGIWFDQPPCVGFANHGYFLYHPKFYRDVAQANGYQVEDIWYSPAGSGPVLDRDIPIRPYETLHLKTERTPTSKEAEGLYYNLNVILRKTRSGPFRLPLELETSHAAVDRNIARNYDQKTWKPGRSISKHKNPSNDRRPSLMPRIQNKMKRFVQQMFNLSGMILMRQTTWEEIQGRLKNLERELQLCDAEIRSLKADIESTSRNKI